MLQVHSSNYLESLLDHLLTRINQGDPFCPEVIVVENPGMSRWLQQRIAIHDGISANLRFVSPAQFIWESAQCWIKDLPDAPQRNSTRLQWQIFALLPDFLSQSAFDELQTYLVDDDSGLQRFQLAGRIAGTFERYLIYRADVVESWQQGKDVHWQAILWRAISPDMPHTWGALRSRLKNVCGSAPDAPLPGRVSVFGVSDMAPVFIDLLQCIGQQSSICIYYLNPCAEYWADIQDKKSQARRRAKAYKSRIGQEDDPTGLLDIGNPLLASWGHAGQSFLDQLLEREVNETESFIEPVDQTLLHCVQRDILSLEDKSDGSGDAIVQDDRSICIHSAHSPLREVQILHDQLLNLIATQPDLKPRDIIVMAPDIDKYAPFVNATFGTAETSQYIPWSISDRRMRSEQQLLEALLQLLQLPESRFESTDVFALLQVPAVRRKFTLERSDLSRLHQWIQESGIRWSLDAAMRDQIGLPAVDINSWHFGLQRMFLGYAMPADHDRLYEGIAPYQEVEGADGELLATLQQFISLATQWRERLSTTERTPIEWLSELEQLAETFFEPDHVEDYALRSFREVLMSSFLEADDATINLDVLIEIVQSALDDNSNVRQFLNGKVTFSNMVPMRCIPFRVICLLGMNADDFPREDRPMSFDLTKQTPRRGDRSRANDDRYLFLETLLSAREVFYLSYVGKDVRDNTDKAPATVVTELLAYLNSSYQPSGADNTVGFGALQHPLQPFSKRYFDQSDKNLHNFKSLWHVAASTMQAPVPFIDSAESRRLKSSVSDVALAEPSRRVDISQLIDFYKRPSYHYLWQRLQVRPPFIEDDLQTSEQFDLNGLEQWSVNQSVLTYGKDMPKAEVRQTLDAKGVLPEGVFGDMHFEKSYKGAIALDARILAREPQSPLPPLHVDLNIAEFSLEGYVPNLGGNGLFYWRSGRKRTKDILQAWIYHLCLCAVAPDNVQKRTATVFNAVTVEFEEVPDPLTHLQRLLELRHQGLLVPQPFFPEASFAFANGGDEDTGMKNAWKAWVGGQQSRPESHDDLNQVVWRGQPEILGSQFQQLAIEVLQPLQRYSNEIPESDELPDTLPDDLQSSAERFDA